MCLNNEGGQNYNFCFICKSETLTIEPHNSKALALLILSRNGSFLAEFVSITVKQMLKIGPRLAPYDLRLDMRAYSVCAAPVHLARS